MNEKALESFIGLCDEMMVPVEEGLLPKIRDWVSRKKNNNKKFSKPEFIKDSYKDGNKPLQDYIGKYSKEFDVLRPYAVDIAVNKDEISLKYEELLTADTEYQVDGVSYGEIFLQCLYILDLSKVEFAELISKNTNKYEQYVVMDDPEEYPNYSKNTLAVIDYFKKNQFIPVMADGGGNTLYYSVKLQRFYDMFHERYARENLTKYTSFKNAKKAIKEASNQLK